jgi:hypothetical protein
LKQLLPWQHIELAFKHRGLPKSVCHIFFVEAAKRYRPRVAELKAKEPPKCREAVVSRPMQIELVLYDIYFPANGLQKTTEERDFMPVIGLRPLQLSKVPNPPPPKVSKVFGPCWHVSVDEAKGRNTFEIFEQVQRKKEAT